MSDLTPKERRFCEEYLITLKPTVAARTAGIPYKRGLIEREDVQEYIQQLMDERAERTGIDADKVLGEIGKMAFSNIMDYIKVDDAGFAEVDLSQLTRDQAAAIMSLDVDVVKVPGAEGGCINKVKFKLADKLKALEQLGKHLKLFTDKTEISGPDGDPIEIHSDMDPVEANRLYLERMRGK